MFHISTWLHGLICFSVLCGTLHKWLFPCNWTNQKIQNNLSRFGRCKLKTHSVYLSLLGLVFHDCCKPASPSLYKWYPLLPVFMYGHGKILYFYSLHVGSTTKYKWFPKFVLMDIIFRRYKTFVPADKMENALSQRMAEADALEWPLQLTRLVHVDNHLCLKSSGQGCSWVGGEVKHKKIVGLHCHKLNHKSVGE